ncbi:MAG: hypothetical protein ACREMQ_07065, partial [Longimicrobiales bacterium]
MKECQVELRDEEVGVVACVAHDREALGVAGQVVGLSTIVAAEEELVTILSPVKVRLACRAGAVDGFQVEARIAEIAEAPNLLAIPERGAVVRHVMGQDLGGLRAFTQWGAELGHQVRLRTIGSVWRCAGGNYRALCRVVQV